MLGSDSGSRSMINRCKQCLQVAIENTPDVISADEERDFYISWAGKGRELNLAPALASQPAAGHSLSFIILPLLL